MSSFSTLPVATLGTPRIGPRRELKFALERFWSGKISEDELKEAARALRLANWGRQKALGVTVIPSNDFSLYDHVLDTSVMVGAIPEMYGWDGGEVPLAIYFAMARGAQGDGHDAACAHGHAHHAAHGAPAQEMTKWFDTNYHYMVPEFREGQTFALASRKPIEQYLEAKGLGYETRPVLVGPVTFLKLGKSHDAAFDRLSLLDRLIPVYVEVLRELKAAGASWVQIDEPCLVLDLDDAARQALRKTYRALADAVPGLKIMLTTYFGGLGDNLHLALDVAGGRPAPRSGARAGSARNGRRARAQGSRAVPRCHRRSQHLARQPAGDPRPPGAGGRQTRHGACADRAIVLAAAHADRSRARDRSRSGAEELARVRGAEDRASSATLGRALADGRAAVRDALDASATAAAARKSSPKIHDADVAERIAARSMRRWARAKSALRRARMSLQHDSVQAAGLSDHDDRLVSADRRRAQGTRSPRQRRDSADADYETFLKEETGACRALAGGDRARRAGARRVRAQRHGAVFRRAARRLRLHQAWLGAVLRLALRAPADPVRRRVAAEADDGRLVALCAVADEEADEGRCSPAR